MERYEQPKRHRSRSGKEERASNHSTMRRGGILLDSINAFVKGLQRSLFIYVSRFYSHENTEYGLICFIGGNSQSLTRYESILYGSVFNYNWRRLEWEYPGLGRAHGARRLLSTSVRNCMLYLSLQVNLTSRHHHLPVN